MWLYRSSMHSYQDDRLETGSHRQAELFWSLLRQPLEAATDALSVTFGGEGM